MDDGIEVNNHQSDGLYQTELSRRQLLKLSAAASLAALIPRRAEANNESAERGKRIIDDHVFMGDITLLYESSFFAPRIDDIPDWIKNRPPHLSLTLDHPQVRELQQEKNISRRIMSAVGLLGVQTYIPSEGIIFSERDLKPEMPYFQELNDVAVYINTLPANTTISERATKAYWKLFAAAKLSLAYENPRYTENSCNIYAADLCAILGLSEHISHRVNPITGAPQQSGGIELDARGKHKWLKRYAKQYGWFEVTQESFADKLNLLKGGHIFYGAWSNDTNSSYHNWIVFGAQSDGETFPCLTQSTRNVLMEYAHPDSRTELTPLKVNSDTADNKVLYAIKVPN